MPDFLGKEQVAIPQGGDLPVGFTGKWMAAVRFTFLVQGKPDEFGLTPDSYRLAGNDWYALYYADKDAAAAAATSAGQEYPPSQTWLFEAPISTVMLPDEVKANFGAAISMQARVNTLSSKKYRHEFQLIALPAAVAAYANMKGWYEEEFDLGDLASRDVSVTDELSAKLIGGEYPAEVEEEQADGSTRKVTRLARIDYTDGYFFQQRVALWEALGEDDPRKYAPIGYNKRNSTTSERLSECLSIAYSNWAAPVWARVAMVQDPRVDALSGSGNRLTLPALLHIYENEEEARAAAGPPEDEATDGPAEPPLPSGWGTMRNEWIATVQSLKIEMGVPLPIARARLLQMEQDGTLSDTYLASAEEILAWWPVV